MSEALATVSSLLRDMSQKQLHLLAWQGQHSSWSCKSALAATHLCSSLLQDHLHLSGGGTKMCVL